MNAQDKAEALRLLDSIIRVTENGVYAAVDVPWLAVRVKDLRTLIERQDDTDGEMWRFCVEHGFPLKLTNSKWVAHFGGKLHYAGTPAEAVQAAMAAMKEKA